MSPPRRLIIRHFAQIEDIAIEFGDLTVLVGAQATGKSLALQWLKFGLDGGEVIKALRDSGHSTKDTPTLVNLLFGAGMSAAWRAESKVRLDRRVLSPDRLARIGNREKRGRALYIPAHRAMLMSGGWAVPFQRLTPDTPVVARLFSQHLFEQFSAHSEPKFFPVERKLKKAYREAIDDAIFHGGTVGIEEDDTHLARRVVLRHGDVRIPYMAWTAGQREFTPLLLGLYALLPGSKVRRVEPVEWVIVEEPEMGLHPKALNVVLMLILDLLWRGYRVVMSTHSPDILTAVWMLQRLKRHHAPWQRVLEGFELPPAPPLQAIALAALNATYRVHTLYYEDGRVYAQDISDLDVASDNAKMAEWGEITRFSSNYGNAVARAVNGDEES